MCIFSRFYFIFEHGETLLLISYRITGSSSDLKKDDEVKRLPGGKVKKKVTSCFELLGKQKPLFSETQLIIGLFARLLTKCCCHSGKT